MIIVAVVAAAADMILYYSRTKNLYPPSLSCKLVKEKNFKKINKYNDIQY